MHPTALSQAPARTAPPARRAAPVEGSWSRRRKLACWLACATAAWGATLAPLLLA